MFRSPQDNKVIAQAVICALIMTVAGAIALKLPQAWSQVILSALVAAIGNPIIFLIQHFNSKAASTPELPSARLQSLNVKGTHVLTSIIACAACCVIILTIMQTATNALLTTIQNLENEGQLKTTDYGWQVVGNVVSGLMVFLVYLPAISIFSVKFSQMSRHKMGISSFIAISFIALALRAFQNYGFAWFSSAPTMNSVGANIKNSFPYSRDQAFLVAVQIGLFIVLVVIQGLYMRLCSWVAVRYWPPVETRA